MKEILRNIFKKKSQIKNEKYTKEILPRIIQISNLIKSKDNISFLHSGHLGDIVNSLPVIKELSKKKTCNLYIEKNKKIPEHVISKEKSASKVYLKETPIIKLIPLLKKQEFINKVEIFNDQNIDVDLNFFRELPINFNIDSVRWYSHLTGCFPDLSEPYLNVEANEKFKDYIVIMRSLRRQNKFIDYSFLSSYKKLVFIGLKDEFDDLKKSIKNLEYFDSKDFLELASIIKNAKIFIGNLSFGYALAEALKVTRLLESAPNFPLVYPNGGSGYDFYFQNHFEDLINKLN